MKELVSTPLALPMHCAWERCHGRLVRMPVRRDILALGGVAVLDMLATALFNYGLLWLSIIVKALCLRLRGFVETRPLSHRFLKSLLT